MKCSSDHDLGANNNRPRVEAFSLGQRQSKLGKLCRSPLLGSNLEKAIKIPLHNLLQLQFWPACLNTLWVTEAAV